MIYRLLRIACLGVVLGSLHLSVSAQAPNYQAIKDTIANSSSRYYYPFLMERYRLMDTTLTLEDYRYLYYGYPESDDYKPLLSNSYADSLSMAFGSNVQPTMHTFNRVIHFATVILKQEPFNMRDMNVLAYAYAQIGDTTMALRVKHQIDMLIETIRSTGDGLTDKTPWYITYNAHAEDMLNMMNVSYRRAMIISRDVEFFPISNMPLKMSRGYYFNFAPIYAKRPDYLDNVDKPKRRLEFNAPYKPKSKLNKGLAK